MEKQIKLLWITNMMPGFVAKRLSVNGTNKEGWIEGAASKLIQDNNIKLMIAFPYYCTGKIEYAGTDLEIYGFSEDSNHPENYDPKLEEELKIILEAVRPDLIHVFGTEFPHTLALMKLEEWKDKVLIHIQGIMEECEKVYNGNLPKEIVNRRTFRDVIRKDSILEQIDKYKLRAANEHLALLQVKHVLGRTEFDKNHVRSLNKNCNYYHVNETLRKIFYDKSWNINDCNKHEIFISQGNYPLKGAHDVIEAVALIKGKYPDVKLYIAGNKITSTQTIKDRIKLPSYGKYLLELIKKYKLEENVIFTGPLDEKQMLERYMKAEVFVLSSYVENSPNSLGEAMLVGLPSIAAEVGGVSSLADDGKEILMYQAGNKKELADKIELIFEKSELKLKLSKASRERAKITHSEEANYKALLDAYKNICKYNIM